MTARAGGMTLRHEPPGLQPGRPGLESTWCRSAVAARRLLTRARSAATIQGPCRGPCLEASGQGPDRQRSRFPLEPGATVIPREEVAISETIEECVSPRLAPTNQIGGEIVKRRALLAPLGLLVTASLLLAACGGGGPTFIELEEMAFEPLSVSSDCSNGTLIRSIDAVDERTVRFTMCVPDPAFLPKIAFSVFAISPREWLEATTAAGTRLDQPIGTGPYYVSEWVRGESLTFTRYEDYWGEAAETDTVVFRWSTESAARLLELQAGTIDGFDNVGPADFEVVEGDAN